MPWTDESDPSSPATAPNSPAPDQGSAAAGGLDESSVEASASARRGAMAGRKPAGPWGAAPDKRPARLTRSRPASRSAPEARLRGLTQIFGARASRLLTGPNGRALPIRIALAIALGFAAGWGLSGVYEVRPGELAVVTRLGVFEAVAGPGLRIHPPWPLAQARIVSVRRINTLALGDAVDDGSQALTPTADDQMAVVRYLVQWRIADPVAYLFHTANPQDVLRLAAEAATRHAVGAWPMARVIDADHAALERVIATAIQQRLDRLGAGIDVTAVLIQSVGPPPDVQAAAGDVVMARQDAQASVADAQAYRARVIAEARSAAAKTLVDAQSYRDQTLKEAQGAAARFEQLDAAYRKAPQVTKDRLYFETLQGVLSRAHTIVLDPGKGARVMFPPELLHSAAPSSATASKATAASATRIGAKP